MFARHSELKSVLVSSVFINGKNYTAADQTVSLAPNCLLVDKYSVTETARLLILESEAEFRTKDKLLFVVANDDLYKYGEVLGFQTVITPGLIGRKIVISVKPNDKEGREALKSLSGPLASIFVESKI